VAAGSRNHQSGHPCSAVLRESWETAYQIAETQWGDPGFACYLLGIVAEAELQRSPFLGQLFEGFVAAEILKSQVNRGARKELYYFRDQQGLEVDFLIPRPNAGLWLIECKAGKTVRPAMAAPLLALRRTLEKRSTRLTVVHGKSRLTLATKAVASGVEALDLEHFVSELVRDP
jgi:predicted AAA+ superfamily ATPase